MKKILYAISTFCALAFASCIQDEPLNSECDIEQATVVTDDAASWLLSATEAVKDVPSSDSIIKFYLSEGFDDLSRLEAISIKFQLTPGATITPENGSAQNFRNDSVRYRVTSEDGLWHRDYRVCFVPIQSLPTEYSFENFRLEANERYYEWFEMSEEGEENDIWATGNPGFAISRSSATRDEYPTIPWSEESVDGNYAVKLETRDTGPFGLMVNMRIAAGNLFIGTFDVTNALQDAMAATRFGLPFNYAPIRFEGHYKYKPGETFINRNGTAQTGRVDTPDLYAVLYKNTDEDGQSIVLHGDDVLTSPNIVALARDTNYVHDFDNWTSFSIPFEYFQEIDNDVLRTYGYSLAVVFTSSIEGASFCGAVGSTLLVDNVRVICE